MRKKILTKVWVILAIILSLSGCATGPGEFFEPTTYGIRNSHWALMSKEEQEHTQKQYNHRMQIANQLKRDKEDLERRQSRERISSIHKSGISSHAQNDPFARLKKFELENKERQLNQDISDLESKKNQLERDKKDLERRQSSGRISSIHNAGISSHAQNDPLANLKKFELENTERQIKRRTSDLKSKERQLQQDKEDLKRKQSTGSISSIHNAGISLHQPNDPFASFKKF